MELKWGTWGDNGSWCGFLTLNMAHPNFNDKEGVYIVWQKNGPIIKVGKGRIRDKISLDRLNTSITAFNNLLVTWAVVLSINRSGVERYLVERLNPRFSETLTESPSVPVNLPWPYN